VKAAAAVVVVNSKIVWIAAVILTPMTYYYSIWLSVSS
jgi:hypothetical protein